MGFQFWQARDTVYSVPTRVLYDITEGTIFDEYIYQTTTGLLQNNHSCSAVVVYSSTRLRWIRVPCKRQFHKVLVLCESRRLFKYRQTQKLRAPISNGTSTTDIMQQLFECPYYWVQVKSSCYRLVDLSVATSFGCAMLQPVCQAVDGTPGVLKAEVESIILTYFRQWLDNPKKDRIYVMRTDGNTTSCIAKSFQETIYPTISLKTRDETSGLVEIRKVFCERNFTLVSSECLDSQSRCEDGTCVLAHYFCDGLVDCADSSDENSCEHVCTFVNKSLEISTPANGLCFSNCFPKTCLCLDLYFHCHLSGKCIPLSKLCDGYLDCVESEDELLCTNNIDKTQGELKLQTESAISGDRCLFRSTHIEDPFVKSAEYTCRHNHTSCAKPPTETNLNCIPMNKVCLYEISSIAATLRYCPNGEHLHGCKKHTCPSDFKCPMGHCIPHHYVCDGKLDCPYGEDEENCPPVCPGMLRCRHNHTCVHRQYVGNGEGDCTIVPDDEMLQDLVSCPELATCICLGRALSCPFANLTFLPGKVNSYKAIIFAGNRIESLSSEVRFSLLLIFNLSWNHVVSVSALGLRNMPKLVSLDLSHNVIAVLNGGEFGGLRQLQILNLGSNSICCINPRAFHDLLSLKVLDLSHNSLHTVHPDGFTEIQNSLLHLNYQGNIMTEEFLTVVENLHNLEFLSLDLGSSCNYVRKEIRCSFVLVNYLPCCRLINNKALLIIIWVFIIISVLFNIISILFASLEKQNATMKLLLLCLHCSDTLIISYFIALSAMDIYYGDMFLYYHLSILRGLICHMVAVLLALADTLSLVSLVLNCFQRLFVVMWPLKELSFSGFKWYATLFITSAAMLLTIVFIPRYISGEGDLITTPCVLAPVVGTRSSMYLYFLLLYLSVNCTTRIIAAVFTVLGLRKLKASDSERSSSTGGKGIRKSAIRRHRLILFDNILSWLVVCVVQTVLLVWQVDSTAFAMASVPLYLRCLVHPLIYTFSTQRFLSMLSALVCS